LNESFIVTNPTGNDTVAVTDTFAAFGAGVTVTAVDFAGGPLGRLQLNTLGGDDTVTVDVTDEAGTANGIIGVPITFDGGLGSDNAINYTAGSVAGRGLVTVDAYESIEFSHKTNLVINGLAGDDTINLNNPSTPTGLTSITASGGDPSADGDTVVVNGTPALDTVNFNQFTLDGARITGLGPTINVATAEHLTYAGQGGS